MMKNEFEERLGYEISKEEWKDIEYVYQWHPSIDDVNGKDQMVTLYQSVGMGLIRGMIPIAEKAYEIEAERLMLNKKERMLDKRQWYLQKGSLEVEEAIEKLNKMYMDSETTEEFDESVEVLEDNRVYSKDVLEIAKWFALEG